MSNMPSDDRELELAAFIVCVTFNCPYLNINNVPIKVNHRHAGNEMCSASINREMSLCNTTTVVFMKTPENKTPRG